MTDVTAYDDEPPEQAEEDPRWEVQPVSDSDDDSGGIARPMLIALIAATLLAAAFVWLVSGPVLSA